MNHRTQATPHPIDWRLIHALIPWLAAVSSWLMWAGFLLIPSTFGLHYAGMFPAANNAVYVMMGLTLTIAATIAAQSQHGVHAILFAFSTLLLSYWF
ncbi:hypothetical protein [Thiothrix unzii]|jgi:hypothetical protein|uniref:hypothetical protein n=1 Tax=Thiothrix unzii TaxID=111769 RepID=UPI002A35EACE|nr:hypothetical protein [Thiothrix unzii]MDX9989021.1 hypothetical protein [Thiothrix unzii]